VRFFNRGEQGEIERELRAARPEARDEFVQALAQRTRVRRPVRLGWRVGLAGGLTAALLLAIASVGGTSTVSPVVHLGSLMKSAVGNGNGNSSGNRNAGANNSSSSSSESSASDQYKFLVCHHPPGNPGNFRTLSVGSQAAVDAHVANHPGDHPGACGPNG
jgi:hypothetical protein